MCYMYVYLFKVDSKNMQSLIKTDDTEDIKWINITVRNKKKVKQIETSFRTFYKSHTCK